MASDAKSDSNSANDETVLFEDRNVKVTDQNVYIKWYFFPWAGTKRIPIHAIRDVEKRELGWAKARLWGMPVSQWGYWLAGDRKRFSKTHFVGIHVDSSVKPSFTTENIDQVYNLIKKLVLNKSEEKQQNQEEEMALHSRKEQ